MYQSTIADRVRTDSTVAVLREPAFAVISRLESVDPSDQIRAAFLSAVVMAEAVGLDPHEEVQRAKRIMAPAEADYTYHVQAIRDYAANELNRRPS